VSIYVFNLGINYLQAMMHNLY